MPFAYIYNVDAEIKVPSTMNPELILFLKLQTVNL